MATDPTPQERARRARAARLLGDLLPEVTSDEQPHGWGEGADGSGDGGTSRDDELRRDVPPHHGKD